MPVATEVFRITLKQTLLSQQILNVFYYDGTETPGAMTALELAEAFWDHVKAAWRPLIPTVLNPYFQSVLVEEVVGGLRFAEFPIPIAEQNGTRVASSPEFLAPFISAGVKLTVGTRETRPGSKRIALTIQADLDNQFVEDSVKAVVETLAGTFIDDFFFGPLSVYHVTPVVFGDIIAPTEDDPTGRPAPVTQPVTGFVVADLWTSQVTRKIGRGS